MSIIISIIIFTMSTHPENLLISHIFKFAILYLDINGAKKCSLRINIFFVSIDKIFLGPEFSGPKRRLF